MVRTTREYPEWFNGFHSRETERVAFPTRLGMNRKMFSLGGEGDLNVFKVQSPPPVPGFASDLIISFGCGLVSIALASRIEEASISRNEWQRVQIPLQDGPYVQVALPKVRLNHQLFDWNKP